MNKRVIILIIGIIALLVFQAKVVMPLVYDVVSSDLFLEDTGDDPSRVSQSTAMTDLAYSQCNSYISTEVLPNHSLTFSLKPINAFSLGNFQYVVNANIEILPADGASFTKKYVCRIQYKDGDDTSSLSDPSRWSVSGVSGLDNI